MLQRTYRVERKAIWLAGCSAVLVAGGTPVSAIAQSTTGTVTEEAQAADSQPAGELVVTGTRIDRPGFESPTPLLRMPPEELQAVRRANLGASHSALPTLSPSDSSLTSRPPN